MNLRRCTEIGLHQDKFINLPISVTAFVSGPTIPLSFKRLACPPSLCDFMILEPCKPQALEGVMWGSMAVEGMRGEWAFSGWTWENCKKHSGLGKELRSSSALQGKAGRGCMRSAPASAADEPSVVHSS